MSYQDIAYLNMPSFWTEFFNDKKLLDNLYEASLTEISDSYADICKSSYSLSCYRAPSLATKGWSQILVDRSRAIVVTIGSDTYEILPVDTGIVDFLYLASKPNLSEAATVLTRAEANLLVNIEDLQDILKLVGRDPSTVEYSKAILAKNSYILNNDSFYDSRNIEYTRVRHNILVTTRSFKYTATYSNLSASISQTLSLLFSTRTMLVRALKAEEIEGSIYITLEPSIDLPTSYQISILDNSKSYKCDLKLSESKEKSLTLWACRPQIDTYRYHYNFGFPVSERILESTSTNIDMIRSLRQLSLESPSSRNFTRSLACLQGSRLFERGELNGEVVLSCDLSTGRIVTSQNIYDHSNPFSFSYRALLRSKSILINSRETDIDYTYMLYTDLESTGTSISSLVYTLFTESDIVGLTVYNSESYSRKLLINNSIHCEVLYLGRDYLIVESSSAIQSITSLKVLNKESGLVELTLPIQIGISVYKLNSIHTGIEPISVSDTTLSEVNIGDLHSAPDHIKEGLVLPVNLYNTTPLRRLVSSKEFPYKVGSLPLHVVGDYNLFVSDTTNSIKSSAYYILNDLIKHNSAYCQYTSIDLKLGFSPESLDTIYALYGLSGTSILHREYSYIVDILDFRPYDVTDVEVNLDLQDTLTYASISPQRTIGDSTISRRYLRLSMPASISSYTNLELRLNDEVIPYSNEFIEDSSIELYTSLDIHQDDYEFITLANIHPISIVSLDSVGYSTNSLGLTKPLIGTSSTLTSPGVNSVVNQGILSSVGPIISVT
jgi:hypothetical protein